MLKNKCWCTLDGAKSSHTANPRLQIIALPSETHLSGKQLALSDGKIFMKGLLTSYANEMFLTNQISKFSVIKLQQYWFLSEFELSFAYLFSLEHESFSCLSEFRFGQKSMYNVEKYNDTVTLIVSKCKLVVTHDEMIDEPQEIKVWH